MIRWLILVAACAVGWAQGPCASEEHKRYDHLLGGRFQKAVHGCVIVEETPGVKGIHFHDAAAKKWRSVVISGDGVTEEFSLEKPARPAARCAGPEHSEFDFWLGKWEVFTPRGVLAGTNHVHKAAGGCVLVENWTAANLAAGLSLNFRDGKRWRQVWVSPQGVLEVAGVWDGAALRYRNGESVLTFTPNRDGTVRQYWEQKRGETWSVAFDGTYRRAREWSLSELTAELEAAGQATEALFSSVTGEQARFRQAEGRWTLAEILDHLVESEKLFQRSAAAMEKGSPAFDPGFVESLFLPIIGNRNIRLTAPEALLPKSAGKAPGELLQEFRALRAETLQALRGMELRGGRKAHPLGGMQLDAYQWLLMAAAHNRRHLEQAVEVKLDPRFDGAAGLRGWQGRWTGEGKFQGAETKIDLTWTPVLDGKFDELRISLSNGFRGRAIYGKDLQAHWTDSAGNAYAVKGAYADRTLTADWGRGRSTYTLRPDGRMEVRDEVQGRAFATYLLQRETLRPSSVWDIRRVNGEVTRQVAVYTGGPLADVDAVYYVEAGRATIEAGTQRIPVQPGSLVTVKKGTARRFLEAEEGLRVLVFFGEGG